MRELLRKGSPKLERSAVEEVVRDWESFKRGNQLIAASSQLQHLTSTQPLSLPVVDARLSSRALCFRHLSHLTPMSSTPAGGTSTTASTAAPAKKELPQLLPLEEDDEFEEFPSEDWDDKDTFAASLDKGAASEAKGTGSAGLDSLWEDSWDDDDVGDDFSVQLRGELLKQNEMQE
ncbi:DSS1/SEM1 family-domain-containing protein [Leucosporidium creatinivorum]|uniref:26S proteasome complex subunit SEM1 n=1 Tax=Leucosporidium creatinivorum TaxID=106004 RepID=A0A1Y2C0L8_9BASI|nr:DSS1/SEM1 family-domain-containing protein [Leucosporidium creatinivorum]